jgi:NADP+-dependent farnesol dehydrogenase
LIIYQFHKSTVEMEKWEGKVAVVTGASSGIGEAITKDFARNGINVVGLARRSEKIEEYASKSGELKGKIYAYKCDVSDLESVKSAFKWIEEKFGLISILVNNAGFGYNKGILNFDTENQDEQLAAVINTNVNGVIYCSRQGYQLIKKSNDFGIIINISSIVGNKIPFAPGLSSYAPSKFAVTTISEVLRQELIFEDNNKIRVSNISPGHIKTDFFQAAGFVDDKTGKYEFLKGIPYLKSEDVANAVRYILETPTNVNIFELTIKPVGEKM